MRPALTMAAALIACATACLSAPSRGDDPDPGDGDGGVRGDGGPPVEACGQPTLLADPFDAIDLAPWSTYADAPMMIDAAGELTITYANTGLAGLRTRDGYRLHDSSTWIEVNEVPATDSDAQLFFLAKRGNGESVEFKVERGQLYLQWAPVEGTKNVQRQLTYDPLAHHWWRLREEDGQIHWDVSPGDDEWETLASLDDPFPLEDLNIYIHGGANETAGEPGFARLDSFNGGDGTSGVWCKADTRTDGFGGDTLSPLWEPSAPDGCTISQVDGMAEFAISAGWTGECSLRTRQRFDLRGTAVRVRPLDIPLGVAGTVVELSLEQPGGEALVMQVEEGVMISALTGSAAVWSTDYVQAQHDMWRIRDAGPDSIAFDTWDGSEWKTRRETFWDGPLSGLVARLRVRTDTQLPDGGLVVHFDDFNRPAGSR
ncbi:MAG TPA: hypothetical protein VMZ28_03745 [Kofleriaceae bacterium]|nr:hypothetical protein [Kofleriaceae bacterium]